MSKTTLPTEQRDNTISLDKLNQKNRREALLNLELGKLVEHQRHDEGFIWVKKGRTRKQINPDNLEEHLHKKWKLT